MLIKVCRAFGRLPNEVRSVEVVDYNEMLAEIGEVPQIDDAFYYGFCGGGKNKSRSAPQKSRTGVAERKALIQSILTVSPSSRE